MEKGTISCSACWHQCRIPVGKVGICGVRRNQGGKLQLLVWGKAVGLHPDPVEKKPLYHFLPATTAYSFGTVGCNFGCLFCQNWQQSQPPRQLRRALINGQLETKDWQAKLEQIIEALSIPATPSQIVAFAKKLGCASIAYTYNEPTVFWEYALETMKLAKKEGLANIWVTNGFFTPKTRKAILPYLDAANIDLKSFNPSFYRRLCQVPDLTPVLENIKALVEAGVWLEVTTLIIPGENDSEEELTQIGQFLAGVSVDLPWHVTAFHPDYQLTDHPPTPPTTLQKARSIGRKAGLHFVYTGNVLDPEGSTTFCPNCQTPLIRRIGFSVQFFNFKKGVCQRCGAKLAGVWE